MYGGSGDDYLDGQEGTDTVYGGSGPRSRLIEILPFPIDTLPVISRGAKLAPRPRSSTAPRTP
jgi:hypothetical protein